MKYVATCITISLIWSACLEAETCGNFKSIPDKDLKPLLTPHLIQGEWLPESISEEDLEGMTPDMFDVSDVYELHYLDLRRIRQFGPSSRVGELKDTGESLRGVAVMSFQGAAVCVLVTAFHEGRCQIVTLGRPEGIENLYALTNMYGRQELVFFGDLIGIDDEFYMHLRKPDGMNLTKVSKLKLQAGKKQARLAKQLDSAKDVLRSILSRREKH